ncbi:MAG: hypothetical protein LC733_03430 [Actinobacteria bacterium]|nr:hypothetical protein [Actinomycetota bacterium]
MDGVDRRSDSSPVRAWRYWQVSPRRLLRSVSQRQVEWQPDRPLHAVCLAGGHPAPAVTCSCGISAARDLETLRNYGLCVAPIPLVVGEIDLWGRLVEEPTYGYRGEFGAPASILLVRETAEDPVVRDPILEALAAYGVPVGTVGLDEAVAGVTAATLAFQVMSAQASRTLES